MFGLITLFILGLLITAFVLALQYRRKVADLELLTARLRKEVNGIQQRLQALEGQADAPIAPPAVESVVPVPVPVPVPVAVRVPQPVRAQPSLQARWRPWPQANRPVQTPH